MGIKTRVWKEESYPTPDARESVVYQPFEGEYDKRDLSVAQTLTHAH